MAVPPVSEALRRRRPSEPTFDRLMAAGRDLFAANGFAATPLSAVAAACGVTKGSLYHHFASKTALFEAVFEEQSRELCEEVARVVAAERDPWKAAYAGIAAFLDRSQDPAMQRIMLVDAPSVLGWERVREIEASYGLALVRAAVERLIESEGVRRADVIVLSHLLFGALTEGTLLIARADDPRSTRRAVEHELRRLLGGIAA
jgi:AcrR family transcriptional regulator